jgi:hypothetical protein
MGGQRQSMWLPAKDLTILTALHYTNENKQSSSTFLETTTGRTL